MLNSMKKKSAKGTKKGLTLWIEVFRRQKTGKF